MAAVIENKIEYYGNKLLEINGLIAEAKSKKEKLTARRKSIALAATSGNLKAEREMSQLTAEGFSIEAEFENLEFAFATATACLNTAKQEAIEKDEQIRLDKIQELAQKRIESAKLVDKAMKCLHTAFSDHKIISLEIQALGQNAGYPLKGAINRAAFLHQLNEFIEVPRGQYSREHFQSFETIDRGNMNRRGIKI